MKYDIQALQIFQEVLESIKEGDFYNQVGLCRELQYVLLFLRQAYFPRFAELQTWMHGKYMPDKRLGAYWWPVDECHEELEQAQKDRIAFLERIIEDLMCGE